MVPGDSAASQYATALAALAGGFLLFLIGEYAPLFITGALPIPEEALNAILSIQFVPLLAIVAVIAVYTWRQTNSPLPGAFMAGLSSPGTLWPARPCNSPPNRARHTCITSEQLRDFAVRAATIDERLSSDYEPIPNLKTDTEVAARRLAAWCQSASSGDWNLFAKRLSRDGLTMENVMPRLAAVRLAAAATLPSWVEDAAWIVPAMLDDGMADYAAYPQAAGPTQPFEDLFHGLIAEAERRRDAVLPVGALARVEDGVRSSIAHELLSDATKLCGMAIYENFAVCRKEWQKVAAERCATRHYDRFSAKCGVRPAPAV